MVDGTIHSDIVIGALLTRGLFHIIFFMCDFLDELCSQIVKVLFIDDCHFPSALFAMSLVDVSFARALIVEVCTANGTAEHWHLCVSYNVNPGSPHQHELGLALDALEPLLAVPHVLVSRQVLLYLVCCRAFIAGKHFVARVP